MFPLGFLALLSIRIFHGEFSLTTTEKAAERCDNEKRMTTNSSFRSIVDDPDLPIIPVVSVQSQNDSVGIAAIEATNSFFAEYTGLGGWMDLTQYLKEDDDATTRHHIERLRMLATTIMMGRNMTCATPKVTTKFKRVKIIPRSGAQYCFWDQNDLVSVKATMDFRFERDLWQWVTNSFRNLTRHPLWKQRAASNSFCPPNIGFLDVGVNVGDWAVPLRLTLPQGVAYIGIEGTPSTGALATANMLTALQQNQLASPTKGPSPTALLPFSLLHLPMIEAVKQAGGVCFETNRFNVGSQGVKDVGINGCSPRVMAGATLLPHALRALPPLQHKQQSVTCDPDKWPRFYIAKFDIQGFEFRALASAMEYFAERPPCYLMLELEQKPQVMALVELVLHFGYDSAWRTANHHEKRNMKLYHYEFPPDTPFYTQSRKNKVTLHEAVKKDLDSLAKDWHYKNYIFGFRDQDACLRRLLE